MYNRTTGSVLALLMALLLALGGCTATGPRAVADGGELPAAGHHLLMAEIAAARGAQAAAAAEYLDAAEHSDDPQASEEATRFAFAHGFDAWALRAARRWTMLAPEENTARLYLARLLLRRNDIAAATAQAEAALGPAAGRSDADYGLLAAELADEGNIEGLSRLWARLASQAPPSPGLQLALAGAALRAGDVELALAAAVAVGAGERLPAQDVDAEAQRIAGRALLARGDVEPALALARRQVQRHPGVDSELEHASLLAAAGRDEEALAVLSGLDERHGEQPVARRLRGLISIESGDLEAAWEQFQGLVSHDELGAESYFRLAELAMRQQQLEMAVQMLVRIEDGPWLLPARDALARIVAARGDLAMAMQLFDALVAQHPELGLDVARRRASLLERQGELQGALELLDDIVRYQPDDAGLRLRRGALLEQMGRIEPALADMAAAARLMPDDAMVLNAYGYTLASHTSRRAEAHRLIRRALEREPDDPAILDSYGWILYRQGQLARARGYLELAHARLPDPEVAAHLGEVLWQQGEHGRARQLWEDALQLTPDSRPLRDTMARFPR